VPDKGLGSLIADRQVLTNRRLERPRAAMRAAFDLLLRQRGQPPLDQVEPGRAGGCEMYVQSGMPSEPPAHRRGLVRAVVVQNQMDVQSGRRRVVDRLEKAQAFSAAVAAVTLPD